MINLPKISRQNKKLSYLSWVFLILVFGFCFVGVSVIYNRVVNRPVRPATRLLFSYGDELYNIKTNQDKLEKAVREAGIITFSQDEYSLDRNTMLGGQTLNFSIKKSWPILIYDEQKRIEARTTKMKINEILDQNNLKIWPEDRVLREIIMDPVKMQSIGEVIRIKRAPHFFVKVDGKNKEVRSWDNSVKTIIEKSNTKLNPNDIVSFGLDMKLSNGETVVITRIEHDYVTVTESIKYNTIFQGSTSIPLGQVREILKGTNGVKMVTYKVTYRDGQEIGRIIISSKIVQPKQDAKILRGAIIGRASYVNNGVYPNMSTAFRGFRNKKLNITNLSNGRSVVVKVVDYGPDVSTGRILDLSQDAFVALGGRTFLGLLDNLMVQVID